MRRARAEAAASGRLDVDAIDPEVKHTAWRTGRDRATTPPSDARWSRLTTRQRPCQARQPMPPRKSRWRCLSNRGSGSALRGSSIGARRAANRRRKADALPAVGGTIANSGTTHGHRTDAGHDLALGQMPMAHQPAVAIIGQLSLHSKRILPEPRHRHPGRLDSAERGEGGDIIILPMKIANSARFRPPVPTQTSQSARSRTTVTAGTLVQKDQRRGAVVAGHAAKRMGEAAAARKPPPSWHSSRAPSPIERTFKQSVSPR